MTHYLLRIMSLDDILIDHIMLFIERKYFQLIHRHVSHFTSIKT